MRTRNLAWGIGGGISFFLAMACGGTRVNDVGDVNEGGNAGSGGKAGVGGFYDGVVVSGGCGGSDYVCNAGGGLGTAGTSVAGSDGYEVAGTGSTGLGSGGGSAECFGVANPSYPVESPPTIAPQNSVFVDAHNIASDMVRNYADQQIFTSGQNYVLEAYANFAASTAATDTAILLPAQLSQVGANLGQFYIARPNCAGKPVAGHKLTVEFWWKLGGAVTEFPTHGVALGMVSSKNKAVWFDDTVKAFVIGQTQDKRVLNTLNKLILQHTFADDDATDASKVTLGVWLLPDTELPSTFYIGNVQWD